MKTTLRAKPPPRQGRWTRILQYWLPVVAMAALIFFFSTEHFGADQTDNLILEWVVWFFPKISYRRLLQIQFLTRKLAHWAEYFVFSILLLRALRNDSQRKWETRHAVWALLIVFFYALGDEFHQTFVPNRYGSLHDVMIDLTGGICGAAWMYWLHKDKNRSWK